MEWPPLVLNCHYSYGSPPDEQRDCSSGSSSHRSPPPQPEVWRGTILEARVSFFSRVRCISLKSSLFSDAFLDPELILLPPHAQSPSSPPPLLFFFMARVIKTNYLFIYLFMVHCQSYPLKFKNHDDRAFSVSFIAVSNLRKVPEMERRYSKNICCINELLYLRGKNYLLHQLGNAFAIETMLYGSQFPRLDPQSILNP